MNKIVKKKQFSEKVYLFEIEAPLIAKSRKAGNFVIFVWETKANVCPSPLPILTSTRVQSLL